MTWNDNGDAILRTRLSNSTDFFLVAKLLGNFAVRDSFPIWNLFQKIPNLHLKCRCLKIKRQNKPFVLARQILQYLPDRRPQIRSVLGDHRVGKLLL